MAIDAALVGARASGGAGPLVTTSGTTTSGSTFCIAISYGPGCTVSTVVDSKSNTYTKRGSTVTSGIGNNIEFWAAENGTGGASHTGTVTFSGNPDGTAYLIEITGAATASVDKDGGAADATSPYETTLATLSQADELVLSMIASSSGSPTYASTNGTLLSAEEDGGLYWTSAIAKRIVASTTGPTVGFTGGNADSIVAAVSFKQASVGGITPSVGALVLAGIAATVAVTGSSTRVPTVGALTLSGNAPTVADSASITRTPTVGSLVLTGIQPVQDLTVAAPIAGALSLSGNASTVLRGTVRQPTVGALTVSGNAPSLLTPRTITGSLGSLTLTGLAPTITVGSSTTQLIPVVGSITINGNPVTVNQSSPLIRPTAGALTLSGNAPASQATGMGYLTRPFSFNWWIS